MDIALLNVRIMLQKNTVMTDSIGNHKNGWMDYYSCHATAGGESPKEDAAAGAVADNGKTDFTVRWCKAVSAADSTGYRVVHGGEIYNILGIDHMNFKKKSVKFRCQKAGR